jgi:hypothetical protein
MNKYLILSILILFISCNDKKTIPIENNAEKKIEVNIDERLKSHFELFKITPSVIINNTSGNQTEIEIGNHKINWLNNDYETKVKIDNDTFSLRQKNIKHREQRKRRC